MSELRWEARTSQVRTRGREEPRPASRYLGPQLFGCPGFEEQSLPRMLRGPEREGPAGEMQGLEWAAGPQPQSHPRAGWTVALNIRRAAASMDLKTEGDTSKERPAPRSPSRSR